MAGASEIVACQRELAAAVAQMLALARAGQWKQLPELDWQCTSIAGRLRAMEVPALPAGDAAALAQLAVDIGAARDELNALVQPQFIALVRTLGEQRRPHARMRGRKPTHDPEKCPPGGARSPAGGHAH
ncbi:flagellar protein FliT [Caenimonas terrae]|uniref:Flagellar protein FliT n=1 Tax=Caenimonas terrae TaxID=696074 RepID=A0ABW0NG89_9BURK